MTLYAHAGATAISTLLRGLQHTCRLDIDGAHPLLSDRPVILAYWHEWALAGFVFMRTATRPLACLCHPSPKLAPRVELGRRFRWRVVLGSTGHGGREASDEIVRALREGLSTFVCPGGPSGPPHAARAGAIHMSTQSGAPIVPIRFSGTRSLRLPSWDRMHLPLPGSTIRAHVGAAVSTLDELTRALG